MISRFPLGSELSYWLASCCRGIVMVDMSASTDAGGAFLELELKLLEFEYESNRRSMLSLVVLEMDQEDEDADLDEDGVSVLTAGAKASACCMKEENNDAIARDSKNNKRGETTRFDILAGWNYNAKLYLYCAFCWCCVCIFNVFSFCCHAILNIEYGTMASL